VANNKTPEKRRHYHAVQLNILFMMAWKNLYSKKLRSILTIFGVVIGIGAIFFLLSFGLGLQKLVTDQVIGDQSVKSIDITSPNSRLLKLNEETVNEIKQFQHVENAGVLFSYPGSLQNSGGEVDSVAYGIDLAYQDMTSLNLIKGRLLNDQDYRAILINTSALDAIGIEKPEEAVGKKLGIVIPLNNPEIETTEIREDFEIVGVIDSGGGSEVFMPANNFSLVGITAFQSVKVIADDSANVPQIRSQIESIGLQTTSPVDTLDQINEIFKFFTFILIGFGSIGMVVSVLGMFNTLTISLLERTREIGLMMALGGRNSDMRKLFIFEAVLISFFGSVAGIILAIIGGQIVNFVMNQFAGRRGVNESFQIFSSPLWAIMALVSFTILVGLAVVYIPARRAQRIDPIDALRRE
jgi:putative ABC transport system permease protein